MQGNVNDLTFRGQPPAVGVANFPYFAPHMPKWDAYENLPRSVRVGGYDFLVEVSEMSDSVAGGEFGHTNLNSQKIRLAPNQRRQNLANTFLHEIVHAIHWVFGPGMGNGDATEETYTNQVANGLCQFFQDNPVWSDWFAKANKREGA